MTESRKYRKIPDLVMLRKVEKRSWVHIQNWNCVSTTI